MKNGNNKPVFNVCEPFAGVTIVQMNDPMRLLISQFIHEVDDAEPQMRALGLALFKPQKSAEIRRQKLRGEDEQDY